MHWTSEQRDHVAPKALKLDMFQQYVGEDFVYMLHIGTIYEATINEVNYPEEDVDSVQVVVSSHGHFEHLKFLAEQLSLLPLRDRLGWRHDILMFADVKDAMQTGQHTLYPHRKHMKSMLANLHSSSVFKGNKDMPLERNPNFTRA